MKQNKLLIFLIILIGILSSNVLADLKTDRAVVRNDGTERAVAIARFQEPIEGDLYIAVQVNGTLVFIVNEGSSFSSIPAPFRADSVFSEEIVVLDESVEGLEPGRYPLYKVVTQPGADPLDFRNWVGGLGGLRSINFMIGISTDESLDYDNDGFSDDDLNRDGFHDDDIDRDGFNDSDLDRDGIVTRRECVSAEKAGRLDLDCSVVDVVEAIDGAVDDTHQDENTRTRTSGRSRN